MNLVRIAWLRHARLNEKNQTITSTGTVTGCVGGGVVSGTLKATFKTNDPGNCNTLLGVGDTQDTDSTTPGTSTTTWNNHQTSTASLQLHSVAGHPTEVSITGTGTAGLFKGFAITGTVNFTPVGTSDCVHGDLTKVTYKEVTPLEIG